MKNVIAIASLLLTLTSNAQNLSCTLAGDALDTLDFAADSSAQTIKVTYSFMSGETLEFVSETEGSAFQNGQLVSTGFNFVAFNDNSFPFGGAYFNSALVVMKAFNENGSRDVLVSAGGTVYTGSCK